MRTEAALHALKGGETTRVRSSDRYEVPSEDDALWIDAYMAITNAFRAREPKMTAGYIAAFMAVARHPGQGPTDYARMLGTVQPVMSRTLLEIGKKARQREEGLGLVDSESDPGDLRQSRYFLTTKGKLLYKEIMAVRDRYHGKIGVSV